MKDLHVERCRLAMLKKDWVTLEELAPEIGCSESAASSRIRDLRKPAYGNHRIACRRTGPGGLHKYRLVREREDVADAGLDPDKKHPAQSEQ